MSLRILIVEDEAILSLALSIELRRLGFAVSDRVATGEDAIESTREDRPDVVLMDIQLAGDLDGIEAARRIQQESPLPILFMSGFADPAVKARVAALNPLGFLKKPFPAAQVKTALERLQAPS